ncbi:amidase family protein [Bradyrhizobium sp. CIAT3101]|uniref:amidase family protein n=1 Tax=Bradyrhizobium sp. CIAT3101 TaxID=439387 RepID=UPI0024B0F9EE|nr:amidase family protein [Bradyrhizobium sp. CIAT3101]WFU78146.1 amidase family protein [Bradyrhizobium sp. CIAT3101]
MPRTAVLPSERAAQLAELSLAQAGQLIREGEVTSLAYAEALLEACDGGAQLNAFISIEAEMVLEQARAADRHRARGLPLGLLHGVPIAIKDNINTTGLPTSGGTAALRRHRPGSDAMVVDRLRRAGAIVLGKTGLHELSMGWTGDNPHFGRVRNPHAPDRIAGGSSSGSAAAVAARMAPAALGTDTNGSIRIPAALCGIVGYRPSLGRYPLDGVMPLARTLDTVGLFARSVADIKLLDDVLHVTASAQPVALGLSHSLRVGVAPDYYLANLDRELERIFTDAVQRLSAAGVKIVRTDIPELHDLVPGTVASIIAHEAPEMLALYLAEHAPSVTMAALTARLGEDLHLGTGDRSALLADYSNALARRQQLITLYRRHFAAHRLDALMHPVLLMPAPFQGAKRVSPAPDAEINGQMVRAYIAYGRNVAPLSLVGGPALVLPAGLNEARLPNGISFEAPPGHDDALLQLGLELSSVLGPSPCPQLGHCAVSVTPIAAPPHVKGIDDDH